MKTDKKGNTGKENTGEKNSGDWNSGNWNSGDWNSGYRNSGYGNSGYGNSGDWNSTDRETGLFNTTQGAVRCFNKDSGKKFDEIDHPHFTEFYLNKWITEDEMTDEEKEEEAELHTKGGYLKTYTYKEAWANFWKDTDEENRQKFLALPNFDADIFKEITGIDIEKKEKMIELSNGKKVSEGTVMEALKALTE